jgi:hypothetical protein
LQFVLWTSLWFELVFVVTAILDPLKSKLEPNSSSYIASLVHLEMPHAIGVQMEKLYDFLTTLDRPISHADWQIVVLMPLLSSYLDLIEENSKARLIQHQRLS